MGNETSHIDQLRILLDRLSSDPGLKAIHLSLFLAICHSWMTGNFENPFQVSRSRLMRLSRIHSKSNYHRCIRDLVQGGYIKYEPSYHPTKGSRITLKKVDRQSLKTEQIIIT